MFEINKVDLYPHKIKKRCVKLHLVSVILKKIKININIIGSKYS